MMNNGLVNAIIAYIMWGILPLYWKLFNDVPAGEILSHRVVWSSFLWEFSSPSSVAGVT